MSRIETTASLVLGAAIAGSMTMAATAESPPTSARTLALEARGDFFYDTDGRVASMRHIEPAASDTRTAMGFLQKFAEAGITLPERPAALEPRMLRAKPSTVLVYDGQYRDRVVVKFSDALTVRLHDGALRDESTGAPATGTLSAFDGAIAAFPEVNVSRMFSVSPSILDENRESGERISGRELTDLNNYYLLTFPSDTDRAVDLANAVLWLPGVENAYLPAKGATAGSGCTDVSPTSPDFESQQSYLNPAPEGLDARFLWNYHPSGAGVSTFWTVDCEWSWCLDHEDLDIDAADVINGNTPAGGDDPNHGTAVLGVYGSCDNGYGATGMVNGITLKMADFDSEPSIASNITTAASSLLPGEVMLLAIRLVGPNIERPCDCCGQQVPVEYDSASWDAIAAATANGIIVVEAAGNGDMDLDHPAYGGWFAQEHNSWALIVGAAVPGTHAPECFTNRGETVDLHGYGSGVYTTGYGSAWDQAGCAQDYASTFNGTSSASAMIVGAAAAIQNIANQKYGVDISPSFMRETLRWQGTPQGAPTNENIGPMPNLALAIDYIEPDLYPGTPPGWSYAIVPRETADSGHSSATLQAGPLNTSATYWNWTTKADIASPTPTVNNALTRLSASGDALFFCLVQAPVEPGHIGTCINAGATALKGGRHTMVAEADYFGDEEEFDEGNNVYARQFIWEPMPLAFPSLVTRTDDPTGFPVGYGPFPDAEGFEVGTASAYWYVCAVMPTGIDDFDIRLHTETPSNIPQAGFGAYQALSNDFTPGAVDWVAIDRNTVGDGTFYTSVVNYTGPGASNKVVEWDGDQGLLLNGPDDSVGGSYGPFVLGGSEIVAIHELELPDDAETRVHVEWLNGDADFAITVLDGTSGYHHKWGLVTADANPDHGDEYVIVPDLGGGGSTDFHGLVVAKTDYLQRNQAVTYMIHVSALPNLVANTLADWWGPIVPRDVDDPSTSDPKPLSAVLPGEALSFYNWSHSNEGANDISVPYRQQLFVDDVIAWDVEVCCETPSGGGWAWLDYGRTMAGGRHHVLSYPDATLLVDEFSESDNLFTEWFVWDPVMMPEETGVVRRAPPLLDPIGWGPEYSVDGVRAPAGDAGLDQFWAATGVLPLTPGDQYEARMHSPSMGSRDGFEAAHAWSFSAPGEAQFVAANYNILAQAPFDIGILNWNEGTGDVLVQSTFSDYAGDVAAGWTTFGNYELGPNEVLNIHEIRINTGEPLTVGVDVMGGAADVGLFILDSQSAFHDRSNALFSANASPGGESEFVPDALFPLPGGFYCFVVHKTASADAGESCTYRISFRSPSVSTPDDASVVPPRFELGTPSPNPFVASARIDYAIPAGGGDVNVSVFDPSGRLMATLADGFRSPGTYTTRWDGVVKDGRRAAPGVYFVRMRTTAVTETRKVTLVE